MDPQTLPLSNINFESKEWDAGFFQNSNGTNNDSTLLGLVGLAASEDGKTGGMPEYVP